MFLSDVGLDCFMFFIFMVWLEISSLLAYLGLVLSTFTWTWLLCDLCIGYNFQCDIKQLAHSYGELECFKQYEMLLDVENVFKEPRGGLSGLAKVSYEGWIVLSPVISCILYVIYTAVLLWLSLSLSLMICYWHYFQISTQSLDLIVCWILPS